MSIKKFGQENPENTGDNSVKKPVKKSMFDAFAPVEQEKRASRLGDKIYGTDEDVLDDPREITSTLLGDIDAGMKLSADLVRLYEVASARPTVSNIRAFQAAMDDVDIAALKSALAVSTATLVITLKQRPGKGFKL